MAIKRWKVKCSGLFGGIREEIEVKANTERKAYIIGLDKFRKKHNLSDLSFVESCKEIK